MEKGKSMNYLMILDKKYRTAFLFKDVVLTDIKDGWLRGVTRITQYPRVGIGYESTVVDVQIPLRVLKVEFKSNSDGEAIDCFIKYCSVCGCINALSDVGCEYYLIVRDYYSKELYLIQTNTGKVEFTDEACDEVIYRNAYPVAKQVCSVGVEVLNYSRGAFTADCLVPLGCFKAVCPKNAINKFKRYLSKGRVDF